MPIYEYECLQCGKRTEWLQRMSDGPLAACPQCGGEVRKLISAPSFQFKGSGFYKTDYVDKKSGSGSSEGKSENKSEAKAETKPETKSESKPEGKSESSSTTISSESKSTATKSSE
ncbi:MAG TPA: zinc ribbon domain-containing protein [Thermoanaerobaculia bacterium]|nr:zinc ribbon domain-containing protein [Thermoanaerobaculia bacterium]